MTADLISRLESGSGADRKLCPGCGKEVARKHGEPLSQWRRRNYCSRSCASTLLNAPRIPSAEEMVARLNAGSIRNATTGCLEYQGRLNTYGYSVVTWKRRPMAGHRIVYEFHHGQIAAGKIVCHRCDNRRCINPEHLFLGTPADNAADRDNKGRQARGDTSGRARLSATDILEIRQSNQPDAALAGRYGVGSQHIYKIKSRRVWKHI